MKKPETPSNESARLAALHALRILDTPPEERFDRLARLATQLIGVPTALVSLIDEERQWFKARVGLDAEQTGRDISFCGHAILDDEIFVVPDTAIDDRFGDNPLVTGAPHIRFYAGAPLKTQAGFRVGTFCVIDSKPHQLTQAQRRTLRDIADIAQEQLQQISQSQALVDINNDRTMFTSLAHTAPIGIFRTDENGKCAYTNRAWQKIAGMDLATSLGDGWTDAIHPEDRPRIFEAWTHNAKDGSEFRETFRFIRPDGGIRWVRARATPLCDENMNITGWVGTDEDITEQRDAERQLRETDDLFKQMAGATSDVFWVSTVDFHRVLYVSPAYETIWGRKVESLYERPFDWVDAIHPEDRARVHHQFTTALEAHDTYDVNFRIIRSDGEIRQIHDRRFYVRGVDGKPSRIAGIASDVTESHEMQESLQRLATTDPLTGLLNTRAFRERVEAEVLRAKRYGPGVCLAMLDLDRFKDINDSFGHGVGDEALIHVSKMLTGRLRETDTVGRYGGDELCVMLPGTDLAAAMTALSALREAVAATPLVLEDGRRVPLSLSIGVTSLQEGAPKNAGMAELFSAADRALYRAKQGGRNQVQSASLVEQSKSPDKPVRHG